MKAADTDARLCQLKIQARASIEEDYGKCEGAPCCLDVLAQHTPTTKYNRAGMPGTAWLFSVGDDNQQML